MFHVEVRRFPHVARSFNLTDSQIQSDVVQPWVRGIPIVLEERQWTSEKTRLTIYEAPEIAPEERGMGRGWSKVTRDGTEVTDPLLSAAREQLRAGNPAASLPDLKRDLLARDEASLPDVVALVNERHPKWRPSQRLSLVEQAVWELLQAGALELIRAEEAVPANEWAAVLLLWDTWAAPDGAVRVRTTADPRQGPG